MARRAREEQGGKGIFLSSAPQHRCSPAVFQLKMAYQSRNSMLGMVRRFWFLLCLILIFAPQYGRAVMIVTYNILDFPNAMGHDREDDFRVVIEQLNPDVLVVQEMQSQAGVDQFINNVMNYSSPGTYVAAPFTDGPDKDNALFYKVSYIEFVSTQQIHTNLRDISEYNLRLVNHSGSDFSIYSMHLKAGSDGSDQQERLSETTILRNYLNDLPPNYYFLLAGDFNIRSSSEAAYQMLVGSQEDNDGRSRDPINRPGYWHNNSAFSDIHTQSTRTTSFGGGATGGLDDRFDQILISYAFDDSVGLSYVAGTYTAYGNDGVHFNQAINQGTNYAVDSVITDALHQASDHLPVFFEIEWMDSTASVLPEFEPLFPSTLALLQNYPNPFNSCTIIEYQLPNDSWVSLRIYNLLGAEVAALVEGQKARGGHQVVWDASGLASGLYFCHITAGSFSKTGKMLIVK